MYFFKVPKEKRYSRALKTLWNVYTQCSAVTLYLSEKVQKVIDWFAICRVVTPWLYNHCILSSNLLPDNMDLTIKSWHPFRVEALTGPLRAIMIKHKVALSHLRVILKQPKQRSGLFFHSSLWSEATVWYAEDASVTVTDGDNYRVWPGERLEKPAGTDDWPTCLQARDIPFGNLLPDFSLLIFFFLSAPQSCIFNSMLSDGCRLSTLSKH